MLNGISTFTDLTQTIINNQLEQSTPQDRNQIIEQWQAQEKMPAVFLQTVQPLITDELNKMRARLNESLVNNQKEANKQFESSMIPYWHHKIYSALVDIQQHDVAAARFLSNLANFKMPTIPRTKLAI